MSEGAFQHYNNSPTEMKAVESLVVARETLSVRKKRGGRRRRRMKENERKEKGSGMQLDKFKKYILSIVYFQCGAIRGSWLQRGAPDEKRRTPNVRSRWSNLSAKRDLSS